MIYIPGIPAEGLYTLRYEENEGCVIAILEGESSCLSCKVFNENSEQHKLKVISGIKRAKAEGKYKGRQPHLLDAFPQFEELYAQYMHRKFNKGEFAEKLGVSRPTLDRLIRDFEKEAK